MRLAGSEKEWSKIISKLNLPDVIPWHLGEVAPPAGWIGAVKVKGGGWLNTRMFLERSRNFFEHQGSFALGEIPPNENDRNTIFCEGASGLMTGKYGPHRCAKGEILTIHANDWDETYIRIGAGGWLVPQGEGVFRVGSTYEWNELDDKPTEKGRFKVEEIASRLGGSTFEVISHEVGIRPILRRSQPMIGPLMNGGWVFNALGSKGSLYAPGMANRLANWLLDGVEPEAEVDFREFLKSANAR
ncbi:MAG: FAD-binding oxidoreductase [Akkermansiaceae bacterium]|nr:FAD-binding oxidoreductase [Akkermansiaceae bacterium]